MTSTTLFHTALEGTLVTQITSDATTAIIKVKNLNGVTPTWLTGAHRVTAMQSTNTTDKIEVMDITSASQSGSTVTLTIGTRGLPLDGTGFTATGTPQTFSSGAKFIITWDAQAGRQTAFKDIANSFSGAITLEDDVRLYLGTGTEAYIVGKSDNKLYLKDTANSESELSSALASGNDEKVGIDSVATPGYLGAASNDGVLRTGEGLSYTDGGDFVTLDVAQLKDAASSELTISSGAVTRTNSHHTIDTESDASSDDLDTISGGTNGNYITIRAENDARSVVIKHGTGNILTSDNADVTIDTDDKSITLRYDGTNWREVCRATGTSELGLNLLSSITSNNSGVGASSTAKATAASYTILANTLAAGDELILAFAADYTLASGNFDIRIEMGSNILSVPFNVTTAGTDIMIGRFVITTRAIGASGQFYASGKIQTATGSAGTMIKESIYNAAFPSTNDTTANIDLKVTAQFSASDGTHLFTVNQFSVKKANI